MHKNEFDRIEKMNVNDMTFETISEKELFGDSVKSIDMNDGGFTEPEPQYRQAEGTDPRQGFHNGPGFEQINTGYSSRINLGETLPAEYLINAIDGVMPPATKLLLSLAGIKVKTQQFKLTADEKKVLQKPTQDYLNSVNIRLTPLQAMLTAFGAVYLGKALPILEQKLNGIEDIEAEVMPNPNRKNKLHNTPGNSGKKQRWDKGMTREEREKYATENGIKIRSKNS